jgi:hypothetical protein
MQVVKVESCGINESIIDMTDGTTRTVRTYYLCGSPNTGVEWNGDESSPDPFTFSPPWDYIFKAFIDKMGQDLVGKEFIFDVDDLDGNIVKIR